MNTHQIIMGIWVESVLNPEEFSFDHTTNTIVLHIPKCPICKDLKVTADSYPCYYCQNEDFEKITRVN